MTAMPEALVGDLASARRRLTPWLGRFRVALHGHQGLPILGAIAHTATTLHWADAAEELRPLLAPFAGRMPAGNGVLLDLSIDHHLGALALVVDDVAAAQAHAQDAVAFARRMRSPTLEARALALLSTANDAIGDGTAAASARDAAAAIAEPLGMRIPGLPATPRNHRSGHRARPRLAGRWHRHDPPGQRSLVRRVPVRLRARRRLRRHEAAGPAGCLTRERDRSGRPRRRRQRPARRPHQRPRAGAGRPSEAGVPAAASRELQADIEEAEGYNDGERAAKHRLEMEAILDQLRVAVGLGGRDRPQGSGNERARINVARNIRRAIAAIDAGVAGSRRPPRGVDPHGPPLLLRA